MMKKRMMKKFMTNVLVTTMLFSTACQNAVWAESDVLEAEVMEAADESEDESYLESAEESYEQPEEQSYDEPEEAGYEEDEQEDEQETAAEDENDSDENYVGESADSEETDEAENEVENEAENVSDSEETDSEETDSEQETMNQEAIIGNGENAGVSVFVNAPEGSFPEGTEVRILPLGSDEADQYAAMAEQDCPAVGFDIYFEYNGERMQPEGTEVELEFNVSGNSVLAEKAGTLDVYHIGEAADWLGTTSVEEAGSNASISVYADSFSPFVILQSSSYDTQDENSDLIAETLNAPEPREINVVLSDFTITSKSNTDGIYQSDRVEIRFKWDASSYGTDLHSGDYFVVTLPEQLLYTSAGVTINDFDLTNENGVVFGRAVVNKQEGIVTATFNSNVEDKYDVKGTMYFDARVDKDSITVDEENTFTIRAGSSVSTVTYEIKKGVGWTPQDDAIWKNGGFVTWTSASSLDNITQANWNICVNNAQGNTYHNATISDQLTGPGGGSTDETYIENSFRLSVVKEFTTNGSAVFEGSREYINVSEYVQLSENRQSFIFTVPEQYADKPFIFEYKTTFNYVPGNVLRNSAEFTATEKSKPMSSTIRTAGGGGTADATIANRIRLIKVDAENSSMMLSNAEFEVKRPDGSTFTLTTGSDGSVTSGVLTQGTYTIRETKAPAGYVLNGESFTLTVTDEGVVKTIENSRIKTEVSGNKTWNDAKNQDGKRPKSITINLLADGTKVQEQTVTAENNWSYAFTGLDKYSNGKEIVYTIEETAVGGYTAEYNGYNVTNTHTPEKVEVTGSKTWNDAENQDGKRPKSIMINLLANGTKVQEQTVTAENNWSYAFTGLDKYSNGKEIVYKIEEAAVEGYTAEYDGYNVTNTHTPEKVEVSGSKTWNDAENQDGKRPESIEINLMADGEKIETVNVGEAENWSWNFTNLPKYKDQGTEIVYTIEETAVEGYTAEYDGYNVTNTHAPETVEVTGSKTWNDAENQDGKRPESIEINLMADGEKIETVNVGEADNWSWNFANLPKYKNQGTEIVYTIEEAAVEGYTAEYDGYNVTNTHIPETVEIKGVKIWDDEDNKAKKRPKDIEINLLADGQKIQTIKVTAADDWKWKFSDLPKYKDQGTEIVYTISENEVSGYTSKITGDAQKGFTVTNTINPDPDKPSNDKPSSNKSISGKSSSGGSITSRTSAPKTGDDTNAAIWLSIIVIAGCAILFLLFKRRRKYN